MIFLIHQNIKNIGRTRKDKMKLVILGILGIITTYILGTLFSDFASSLFGTALGLTLVMIYGFSFFLGLIFDEVQKR